MKASLVVAIALTSAVSATHSVHPRHAASSCTNVSVVGDATYCVEGAICGDEGDVCPKKGDAAVGDCLRTLSSYVGETAKCVAPVDATCQKIPSGARGCVFGTAAKTSPPATTTATVTATPATTTRAVPGATTTTAPGATTTATPKTTLSHATTTVAPKPSNSSNTTHSNNSTIVAPASTKSTVCSTKWSQCNGQNWPFGVCCEDASFECVRKNDYLSLCEPKQPKKAHSAVAGSVAAWHQCGGKMYRGDSQCLPGNVCQRINEWYSQCQPETTDEASTNELATYAQCGGLGFDATNKVCRDEDQCVKYNEVYSQCVPRAVASSQQRRVHGKGGEDVEEIGEESEEEAAEVERESKIPPWKETDPVPPLEPGPYTNEGGKRRTEGRCAGYRYFNCCDYDAQCNWAGDTTEFHCSRGYCQKKVNPEDF